MSQPEPSVAAASNRSRWLIVTTAVLWSTAGLFAKSPVFEAWPIESRGVLLAFWRASFATIALAPFVRRPTFRVGLLPMSLSFLLMNITFMGALTLTTGANAIWLQNTAPAWIILATVVFLPDRVRRADWMLFGFVAVGIVVILVGESSGDQMKGVLMGVATGFCYACVVLSLRLLRTADPVWLIVVNHLVTALALLPLVIHLGVWPSGEQWIYLAGFGILQMGVPYVLFARGLRSVPSHEASMIALLEPILLPVWVWLAYHHLPTYMPPAWYSLLGAGLILAGLSIRYTFGGRSS